MPKFKVTVRRLSNVRHAIKETADVVVEAATEARVRDFMEVIYTEENDFEWDDEDDEIVGCDTVEGPEVVSVEPVDDEVKADFVVYDGKE